MSPLRYNPTGLHIIEAVAQGVTDLLPGVLPLDGDPGEADDWDDTLVADFPHIALGMLWYGGE